jgi:hypothetical protein
MKKVYIVLILLAANLLSFGQFKITGEIRPRLEYRDGYKSIIPENANSVLLTSQRTRLGLSYTTQLYTTHISFQDVRIWGQEQIKTNQLNIGLNEAWVNFNVSSDFKIKIGRQILKYDNERLLSGTNWNNYGTSHDAVKLSYTHSGWEADFIGAINQSGNLLFESPYALYNKQYKNLGVLWLKKSWKGFSLAHMSMFEGLRQDDVSTEMNTRLTTGLIAKAKRAHTNIDARLFYQSGKKFTGTEVDAYFINLEIKHMIDGKNSITGGFEMLSGNDAPNTFAGKDNGFEFAYGGKHKFNGLMDYFVGISPTKGLGLNDFFIKYQTAISDKSILKLDYHYFKTKGDFVSNGLNYKSYLGSEIDLSYSIKVSSEINITSIIGVMMPTNSMAVVKGSDIDVTNTGFYFVTMLTFKPVFLKNN